MPITEKPGDDRFIQRLAIMDVYNRRILCWIFQQSVRQNDVIALMHRFIIKNDCTTAKRFGLYEFKRNFFADVFK